MAKTKKITIKPEQYINVVSNDFYFLVQKAFQTRGITFIDLNNGLIINGQANLDTLGMISKIPPPKPNVSYGTADHYLIPSSQPKVISYDVEATLNIYEPKDENIPCIFTIRIVNQNDLEFWYNLVAEIGTMFVELDKFEDKIFKARFNLFTLALPDPNDPDSAISAMLGNIQSYRAGMYGSAVSNQYLIPEDDEGWDEDDET